MIGFKSGPVLSGIGISSPIFILIARLFGYNRHQVSFGTELEAMGGISLG